MNDKRYVKDIVNGTETWLPGSPNISDVYNFYVPPGDANVSIVNLYFPQPYPDPTCNLYVEQNGTWRTLSVTCTGSQIQPVDLSAYAGISAISILPDLYPSYDVYLDGVTFTANLASIALGNGSSNEILQANSGGTQNPIALSMAIPPILPTGTQVTLSTTAPTKVDVWNSANPSNTDTPLLGGSGQTSQHTWTTGTDTIPSTLWVGATAGSQSVGDIQFTLTVTPPGATTGVSSTTRPATAVMVEIQALNDPNGAGILNQNVSGQTNSLLVGQYMGLGAEVQAPVSWLANLNYNWSIPGNILQSYSMTNGAGSASQTQVSKSTQYDIEGDHEGTQAQLVQFFWVTTSGNPDLDNIQLTVGNIAGQSFSTSTNFSLRAELLSR